MSHRNRRLRSPLESYWPLPKMCECSYMLRFRNALTGPSSRCHVEFWSAASVHTSSHLSSLCPAHDPSVSSGVTMTCPPPYTHNDILSVYTVPLTISVFRLLSQCPTNYLSVPSDIGVSRPRFLAFVRTSVSRHFILPSNLDHGTSHVITLIVTFPSSLPRNPHFRLYSSLNG